MLGQFGLTWPWESLHHEALAWYDHWLKGVDTGIMDGPPIRYVLPGAEGWQTAGSWPPNRPCASWRCAPTVSCLPMRANLERANT